MTNRVKNAVFLTNFGHFYTFTILKACAIMAKE